MNRCRGWMILILVILLCTGGVWLTLQATAEYPALGEPVSYPVNQVDGLALTIEKPSWSPFKGYTVRWTVTANSKEVYSIVANDPDFEHLERRIEDRWYRLEPLQDAASFNPLDFSLGGEESTGLQGSVVQKYSDYGTRLEAGTYRITLKMRAKDGTPHYLAAEFDAA